MPARCVDASVAIKWVVKGETCRKKAQKFLRDSIAAGIDLIAPPLFEYETESVIMMRSKRGFLLLDTCLIIRRE
jgi:hypothetical protein